MLLWAALAISGLPCAALCCSGLLWAAVPCCALFCVALGCSVLLGAARCAALGYAGLLQPALGCFRVLFVALVLAFLALSKPHGHLGDLSRPSWAVWALLGAFQGPSWSHHGRSWRHLGHLGTLLEPSWSLLEPREGPLGAILGPLGQKHENDLKKDSRISPKPIDFWDNFGIIMGSFSGSIFHPISKQFLVSFWVDLRSIFGSKFAPKAEHFYKAFLESSWSHLESRLGPPGSLLRGLMFQKHNKNRVQMHVRKNASWPRVTSPGPPSRGNSGSFWVAFDLQNGAKTAKKTIQKVTNFLINF